MSLITQLLAHPRLREVNRVAVAAAPDDAWRAARAIDLFELAIVRALFAARIYPEKIPQTARIDDIVAVESGFRLLGERDREVVVGAIGRFWEKKIPFVPCDASSFASFCEPGFGKV